MAINLHIPAKPLNCYLHTPSRLTVRQRTISKGALGYFHFSNWVSVLLIWETPPRQPLPALTRVHHLAFDATKVLLLASYPFTSLRMMMIKWQPLDLLHACERARLAGLLARQLPGNWPLETTAGVSLTPYSARANVCANLPVSLRLELPGVDRQPLMVLPLLSRQSQMRGAHYARQ